MLTFGSPYTSRTALTEPLHRRCAFTKCNVEFMTYEPARIYCCLKHKNSEATRRRRERENSMGPLAATASATNAAQAEIEEKERIATAAILDQGFTGRVEASIVPTLAGYVRDGKMKIENISEEFRDDVTQYLAEHTGTSTEDELEQISAIRQALSLGQGNAPDSTKVVDPRKPAEEF